MRFTIAMTIDGVCGWKKERKKWIIKNQMIRIEMFNSEVICVAIFLWLQNLLE